MDAVFNRAIKIFGSHDQRSKKRVFVGGIKNLNGSGENITFIIAGTKAHPKPYGVSLFEITASTRSIELESVLLVKTQGLMYVEITG